MDNQRSSAPKNDASSAPDLRPGRRSTGSSMSSGKSSARRSARSQRRLSRGEPSPPSPHSIQSIQKFLSSGVISFIIGPRAKEVFVHKDVVSRLSVLLDNLVNGDRKQTLDGRIVWSNVDEDTFLRFSEFAYTGDYHEADVRVIEHSSPEGKSILAELRDREQCDGRHKIPAISSLNGASPNAPAPASSSNRKTAWNPRPNPRPLESHAPISSCHLKLCMLANNFCIGPLEALARDRLMCSLYGFTLHCPARVCDVVQLVREAWSSSAHEQIRACILLYLTRITSHLKHLPEYHQLVEDCPAFAQAYSKAIVDTLP